MSQFFDRMYEQTNLQGTGPALLLGAMPGYQPFSVVGNGNQVYYVIAQASINEWEVGLGTISVTAGVSTLTRTTILDSSNAGAVVNFDQPGRKDVKCTLPASVMVAIEAQLASLDDAVTATDPTTIGCVPAWDTTSGDLRPSTGVQIQATANDRLVCDALAPAFASVADASTVILDLSLANAFQVILGGNRTLATLNAMTGQWLALKYSQDATGGRTPSWFPNVIWADGAAPIPDTTPGSGWNQVLLICIGSIYGVPVWQEISRRSSSLVGSLFATNVANGLVQTNSSNQLPPLDGSLLSNIVTSVAGRTGAITLAESDVANLTTDLAAKAPLASPALTGTPTAPTASPGANTSQLATTAFVNAALVALGSPLNYKGGVNCSANPNYPAGAVGDSYVVTVAGRIGGASGTVASVGDWFICDAANAGGTEASVGGSWTHIEHAIVGALLASNNLSDVSNPATALSNLGGAPLASPSLTGTPTAPTATTGTNTTQIATTAFAVAEVATVLSIVAANYAPKVSPTFTGTPAAPTPSPGTNTTQIATTAFVETAVAAGTAANALPRRTEQSITANYTILDGDDVLWTFGSGITLTLALSSTYTASKQITLINNDPSHAVTIAKNASDAFWTGTSTVTLPPGMSIVLLFLNGAWQPGAYIPGGEATGSGSAVLASNCPAITTSAPHTWIQMISADGSKVFIPAWK